MKSSVIQGIEVEIDEERSTALDNRGGWRLDWCQCDGCNNARMMRLPSAPPEQTQVLKALGLDPLTPYHAASARQRAPRSPHHTQRHCVWFAYGRIVGADATPKLEFDGHNRMWADSRREVLNSLVENLERIEPDEDPDLIYVVTSNRLPWLIGEVCSFRQDYAATACPACGSRWLETGYLRRRSLIPEWMGLSQLTAVLRAGKERVYVEFCHGCGRMEHQVVADRPPFRRKNTLYRDEQRERWPAYLELMRTFAPLEVDGKALD